MQRQARPVIIKFKAAPLALVLTLLVPGPTKLFAQAQEEQPAAEAPAQAMEVEVHPLASFLTAVNIPARATLCGLNSWLASIVMVFSAGMRYADAAKMVEQGCSGPWVITPEMLEESHKEEKKEAGSNIPGGDMVLRLEKSLPPDAAP